MQKASTLPSPHTRIQLELQKLLGSENVVLEQRFPQIKRIADLVWTFEKLIFEVQVSPISAEEIAARNRDYSTLGYQVVWILYDTQFNGPKLTPSEIALRRHPHYFAHLTPSGQVLFYDQVAYIRRKRRVSRSKRYSIDLSSPKVGMQLPRHFPLERKSWPLFFSGDLAHQSFQGVYLKPKRDWFFLLRGLKNHFLEKMCS